MDGTIVARVFRHAHDTPSAAAVVVGNETVTYDQLAHCIRSVASAWHSSGVRRGDRIVLSGASTAPFIYGYFAAHALGAAVVPVDPAISAGRLRRIIEQVEPAAVFLQASSTASGGDVQSLASIEEVASRAVASTAADDRSLPPPDALADIVFTTGTTGAPKGVCLTHANVAAAADSITAFVGNGPADREVMPLPLSLSFGLGRMRSVLSAGGSLILVDGMMFPDRIFRALSAHGASGFCFVPAGLALLLKLAGDQLGQFAEQLRYIEIGSAPMPLEHKHRLMTLLPKTRICMHYGLTEASRSAFMEFHADRHRLHSVGRASPGSEIAIMSESGESVAEGGTGEICVRGPHVMREYWRDPETSRSVRRGDWLRTGDIGYRDSEGYLFLVAREKELINVGGRKVAPAEVEEVLCRHPAIQECACVAIPDPAGLSTEAIKAFLVATSDERPSPGELGRFLRGLLEPYKMPVAYEWVQQIPRTSSGKLQRRLLAQGAP